jgi:ABC-2 type transport system permease protein
MTGTTLVATPTTQPPDRGRAHQTSFAGLVGVELRRLWWRRLTKAAVLAVIIATGFSLYTTYSQSRPEALAQRIDEYTAMRADMERQLPEMIEDCLKQQQRERDDTGDATIDLGCNEQMMQPPTLADMGLTLPIADTITAGISRTLAYLFAFVAFLVAASFVAAEFSTGALGNWLTFQPRRLRVGLSKLLAAGIGGVGLTALGLLVTNLGARMIATVNRPGSDLKLPDPTRLPESLPELSLRILGVAALAGVLGASLGLLLRHSAAVLGVLVGYGVVVELIVATSMGQGRYKPWVMSTNLEAFLDRGTKYWAESCKDTAGGGMSCESLEFTVTYTHGWVYLLVVGVVCAIAALLAFRRRDVI